MNVKKCSTCKIEKGITEFTKKSASRDGLNHQCRDCYTACNRKYYKDNKDKLKHRRRNRDGDHRKLDANRQFVFDYLKTHPCIDCGMSDPRVLEFDHVTGVKKKNVSAMVGYARATILEEIAKCEIRCANCHRIRTSVHQNWYRGLI